MHVRLVLCLFALAVTAGCSSNPPPETSCPASQTLCGESCADLSRDPANCGACHTACGQGQACVNGACTANCGPEQTVCAGACVDLKVDRAHCGACGSACAPGEVCSSGTCALSCQPELTECGGLCVNAQTDEEHCGACGMTCAAGETCAAGVCTVSCQQGQVACDGACVDTQSSRQHCGACNNACDPGEVCDDGTCALSCQMGLTQCAGGCVDLGSDRQHCGACGNPCAAGEVCDDGACELSCQLGLTACDGTCVDTNANVAHCGGCGVACGAGELCAGGTCTATCGGPLTTCGMGTGSYCADTRYDPANCGGCGSACGPYANATAICDTSVCGAACTAPFANCDGSLGTGCETDVTTSAAHCGTCGNACPPAPNAAPSCLGGSCALSCNPGFSNCDAVPANGCEVNVTNSVQHCGACGNGCPSGSNSTAACVMGTCALTCGSGFGNCNNLPGDGCEVNVLNNNAHCGACGNACASGQFCNGTVCTSGIRQLSGTHASLTAGRFPTTHNGVFADPVTGKYYYAPTYTGSTQMFEYASAAALVSNTSPRTINLPVAYEGTYHAALNGVLYYAQPSNSTLTRVNAATGALLSSAVLPGAASHNVAPWTWGGYSDIDLYVDAGNLLYVAYAANGGANLQLSRLDPVTLAVQQTWTIPRVKANTGWGFIANGVFYVGVYSTGAFNGRFVLASSAWDPAYANQFSPVPNEYITSAYYDPAAKRLLVQSNGALVVYDNVQ